MIELRCSDPGHDARKDEKGWSDGVLCLVEETKDATVSGKVSCDACANAIIIALEQTARTAPLESKIEARLAELEARIATLEASKEPVK